MAELSIAAWFAGELESADDGGEGEGCGEGVGAITGWIEGRGWGEDGRVRTAGCVFVRDWCRCGGLY